MINDTIVGMENLPNVFIDKVQVYSDGSGGGVIKVLLMMYDHSSSPSWDRGDIDVKVKVAFESRPEQISNLNTGTKSLFDYEPSPVGISTTNNYDSYVFSTMEFSKGMMDGEYSIYTKSLEYTKPLRQNLNVYAACFVDGFEFGIPMFDKFYGPMSGERIFVGGQLSTLSNYFYYPDTNEEYGGPVHLRPNGTYMEGSAHTEGSHKEVRLVTEENYKIQEFNVDFDIGLVPNNVGDIGSAGNLRDFLGADLQAGRPGLYDREYDPSAPSATVQSPTGIVLPDGGIRPFGFDGPAIEDPGVPDSPLDRIY